MNDCRKHVRKAVFPAAGLGTRFLPATKAMPKEMLPLVDTPLIQYAIEEVINSGIREISIVTGRGKAAIEDHFDVSFELEHLLESRHQSELLRNVREISRLIDVSYIRQKEALGLGHAVLTAPSQIGDEPFAVVLSDDVIDAHTPCTKQLLEAFEAVNGPVLARGGNGGCYLEIRFSVHSGGGKERPGTPRIQPMNITLPKPVSAAA